MARLPDGAMSSAGLEGASPRALRPTPLDLYMKFLAERFGIPKRTRPGVETDEGHLARLAPFQRDAVRSISSSLDRFRGALLTDSPGLGKTHVALAVASELARRRCPALFVLPASIAAPWRAKALLSGQHFSWISHERLSRGRLTEATASCGLVIVDEAHAFRNPLTHGYGRLAALCSGKRVLLISATPVNNRVEDLYHLLRLFAGDATFASLGIPSLKQAVQDGPGVVDILAAVMIRRTRETLEEVYGEQFLGEGNSRRRIRFPARESSELTVGLGGRDAATFDAIVGRLQRAVEEAPLPVFLLAKRLASSPRAFRRTLERLAAWERQAIEGAGMGQDRRKRRIDDLDEEGGVQLFLPGMGKVPGRGPSGIGPRAVLSGIVGDLLPLARQLERGGDPKSFALRDLLDRELSGAKIVVFTEYRDTAAMLYRLFADRPRVAWLHGGGARLASGACSRVEVLERFAPVANGRPGLAPHDEIRLLIATDVLSEGLDLQDADAVVSYDLPWNPVRLLQRAGRIDRIGSPHDRIRVVQFPADPALDELLRLLDRLLRKSRAIALSVGGEQRETADRPMGEIEKTGDGKELSLAMVDHQRYRVTAPGALRRAASLPDGLLAAVRGSGGANDPILACFAMAARTGEPSVFAWLLLRQGRVEVMAEEQALDLLRPLVDRGADLSVPDDESWRLPLTLHAGKLACRLASVAAAGGGSRAPAVRALVRRLQVAQRSARGDLSRLVRLERLEQALGRPSDAGIEARIRGLVRQFPAEGLTLELEQAIERLLGPAASRTRGRAEAQPVCRLLGAVRLIASLCPPPRRQNGATS